MVDVPCFKGKEVAFSGSPWTSNTVSPNVLWSHIKMGDSEMFGVVLGSKYDVISQDRKIDMENNDHTQRGCEDWDGNSSAMTERWQK